MLIFTGLCLACGVGNTIRSEVLQRLDTLLEPRDAFN
jgi:hypothetical protein